LINGRPPIGGDEYVGGRKLETSNVKWRIIIPRGADFDETILRSPPLLTKHEEELNRSRSQIQKIIRQVTCYMKKEPE
jgi:hypothetical protein